MEEVDAIIDKTGSTVFAEIQGYVCMMTCLYFLSLMLFSDINISD